MGGSKCIYHQIPFRCLSTNTSNECIYHGPYHDWLEVNVKAKFGLVHVAMVLTCDHMDYTKTPISFDPCQSHLTLIEQVTYFSIIILWPLSNVDIQAVSNDPLKCSPSFEWQE